jgi:hypothetical protein
MYHNTLVPAYADRKLMFLFKNYVGTGSIERLGLVAREFWAEYLFSELTFPLDVTAGHQHI